jgi:hypothetical protein
MPPRESIIAGSGRGTAETVVAEADRSNPSSNRGRRNRTCN